MTSRLQLGGLVGFVLAAVTLGGCVPGGPLDPGADGSAGASFKLVAGGSDAEFSSQVEYTEFEDETKFEVTIAGGVPGASVDVFINGQLVVTVTLDAAGAVHVEYSTRPDDSGHLPLPNDFPQPDAGDVVVIGTLESTFQVDSSDDDGTDNGNDNGDDSGNDNGSDDNDNANDDDDNDNSDDNGGGDDETILELRAEMAAGSLHAEVKYEEETDRTKLEVEVFGGQPGAVLDVAIAGKVLATLTLDAMGAAHLEFGDPDDDSGDLPFPADFVVPMAGDAVTVGPLSGVFVVDGNSDDDSDDDADDNSNDNSDDDGSDDVNDDNSNDNDDDANDNGDDDNDNSGDDDPDDGDDNGNSNDNDDDDM